MNETLDPMDDLLNRTAPPPIESGSALGRDLRMVSREARRHARHTTVPGPRTRPARVALGAGLAVLLVAGAGTAVAATTFDWAPWAQDPDISYPFALPSGRDCEARVQMLVVTSIDENGRIETAYDETVADHFRAFDAIGASDVEESITEVLNRKGSGSMIVIHPDGQISDMPETPEGPTQDDVYAAAVDDALGDALRTEAVAYGLTEDQWNSNEVILCEAAPE
ncbi:MULTISPECIES: hypothetical protein [unclassified Microbacterium]|uniref:hypothetical protein n=1 Tax=unclassified Microbacterium TaxID=2609290 RepID=UPI000D57E946|nr:hypothetical protein [Microbacterium sp. Gd 4-13]PVW04828.1 hypothetical protein DEA06_08665 [Microbacterium sp. Gd 4-13]